MKKKTLRVNTLGYDDPLTKKVHKAKRLAKTGDPADQEEAQQLINEFLTTVGKQAFGPGWELKNKRGRK